MQEETQKLLRKAGSATDSSESSDRWAQLMARCQERRMNLHYDQDLIELARGYFSAWEGRQNDSDLERMVLFEKRLRHKSSQDKKMFYEHLSRYVENETRSLTREELGQPDQIASEILGLCTFSVSHLLKFIRKYHNFQEQELIKHLVPLRPSRLLQLQNKFEDCHQVLQKVGVLSQKNIFNRYCSFIKQNKTLKDQAKRYQQSRSILMDGQQIQKFLESIDECYEQNLQKMTYEDIMQLARAYVSSSELQYESLVVRRMVDLEKSIRQSSQAWLKEIFYLELWQKTGEHNHPRRSSVISFEKVINQIEQSSLGVIWKMLLISRNLMAEDNLQGFKRRLALLSQDKLFQLKNKFKESYRLFRHIDVLPQCKRLFAQLSELVESKQSVFNLRASFISREVCQKIVEQLLQKYKSELCNASDPLDIRYLAKVYNFTASSRQNTHLRQKITQFERQLSSRPSSNLKDLFYIQLRTNIGLSQDKVNQQSSKWQLYDSCLASLPDFGCQESSNQVIRKTQTLERFQFISQIQRLEAGNIVLILEFMSKWGKFKALDTLHLIAPLETNRLLQIGQKFKASYKFLNKIQVYSQETSKLEDYYLCLRHPEEIQILKQQWLLWISELDLSLRRLIQQWQDRGYPLQIAQIRVQTLSYIYAWTATSSKRQFLDTKLKTFETLVTSDKQSEQILALQELKIQLSVYSHPSQKNRYRENQDNNLSKLSYDAQNLSLQDVSSLLKFIIEHLDHQGIEQNWVGHLSKRQILQMGQKLEQSFLMMNVLRQMNLEKGYMTSFDSFFSDYHFALSFKSENIDLVSLKNVSKFMSVVEERHGCELQSITVDKLSQLGKLYIYLWNQHSSSSLLDKMVQFEKAIRRLVDEKLKQNFYIALVHQVAASQVEQQVGWYGLPSADQLANSILAINEENLLQILELLHKYRGVNIEGLMCKLSCVEDARIDALSQKFKRCYQITKSVSYLLSYQMFYQDCFDILGTELMQLRQSYKKSQSWRSQCEFLVRKYCRMGVQLFWKNNQCHCIR